MNKNSNSNKTTKNPRNRRRAIRRRIKRNANKITQVSKKVKKIQQEVEAMPPVFRSFRPTGLEFRRAKRIGYNQAVKKMDQTAAYAAAIIEPEIPLNTGLLIKQPSLIGIPSTTTTFKNTFMLRTDASGDFFLNWTPNFLDTIQNLSAIKTTTGDNPYNTVSHITTLGQYVGGTQNQLVALKGYVPNISLTKYRLVSAKIKINYTGFLYRTAGFMCGSISYDPGVVYKGYSSHEGSQYGHCFKEGNSPATVDSPGLDCYRTIISNFNLAKIRNGLWPKTINLSAANTGLSAVFIPTDPTDETFQKIGTYYDNEAPFTLATGGMAPMVAGAGAHSNYYFTGHGMDPNVECIMVEVIYNFEILPTAESAPLLRVSDSEKERQFVDFPRVKTLISEHIRNGQGIKPVNFQIENYDPWKENPLSRSAGNILGNTWKSAAGKLGGLATGVLPSLFTLANLVK